MKCSKMLIDISLIQSAILIKNFWLYFYLNFYRTGLSLNNSDPNLTNVVSSKLKEISK